MIVTGGGTGIGRAIAERFAAAGDRVISTGRRRAVLDRATDELEGNVEVRDFDASNPGQVAGRIIRVHTADFDYKGHTHRASPDDPQYEIKSDKTCLLYTSPSPRD